MSHWDRQAGTSRGLAGAVRGQVEVVGGRGTERSNTVGYHNIFSLKDPGLSVK